VVCAIQADTVYEKATPHNYVRSGTPTDRVGVTDGPLSTAGTVIGSPAGRHRADALWYPPCGTGGRRWPERCSLSL
jgi:hypothetical protein